MCVYLDGHWRGVLQRVFVHVYVHSLCLYIGAERERGGREMHACLEARVGAFRWRVFAVSRRPRTAVVLCTCAESAIHITSQRSDKKRVHSGQKFFFVFFLERTNIASVLEGFLIVLSDLGRVLMMVERKSSRGSRGRNLLE
jgi:hypothetical protein